MGVGNVLNAALAAAIEGLEGGAVAPVGVDTCGANAADENVIHGGFRKAGEGVARTGDGDAGAGTLAEAGEAVLKLEAVDTGGSVPADGGAAGGAVADSHTANRLAGGRGEGLGSGGIANLRGAANSGDSDRVLGAGSQPRRESS